METSISNLWVTGLRRHVGGRGEGDVAGDKGDLRRRRFGGREEKDLSGDKAGKIDRLEKAMEGVKG